MTSPLAPFGAQLGSRAVATVLGAVLFVGCASSTTAPRSDPSRPSPTVDGESEEWANGDKCPRSEGAGLPSGVGCLSEVEGDVDGDGSLDRIVTFARLDDRGLPSTWVLTWLRSGGRSVSVPLEKHPFSYPRLVGTVDADRDGDDEIFVKVNDHLYHSGGSPIVGIFTFHRDRLRRVEEKGEPFEADINGVSNYGTGLRCDDVDGDGEPELVLIRVSSALSDRPRWSRTTYEWRGASVVQKGTRRGRMRREGYPDPRVSAYYELRCFELDPPFPY